MAGVSVRFRVKSFLGFLAYRSGLSAILRILEYSISRSAATVYFMCGEALKIIPFSGLRRTFFPFCQGLFLNCVAVGNPCRVIRCFSVDGERLKGNEKWLEWAVELQSLAQAGLTYGKDVYDKDRYQRIRDISADMLAYKTDFSSEKVKSLFCNETGYQTPKLDTRAAIFDNGKILLVRENSGKWSLPGGWVDVNLHSRIMMISSSLCRIFPRSVRRGASTCPNLAFNSSIFMILFYHSFSKF